MSDMTQVPPLFAVCDDPIERADAERELLRILSHCVVVLAQYGLHAESIDTLCEAQFERISRPVH